MSEGPMEVDVRFMADTCAVFVFSRNVVSQKH
jgi:hypothetical protein